MAISENQIQFRLSGGQNNSNPSFSIGGQISNFPVVGTINSVFKDVSKEEALSGKTDYRCLYIVNESQNETLFNASIAIDSQGNGGSSVQIGISNQNEIQEIEIKGDPISGNLVFRFAQNTFQVNWTTLSEFVDALLESLDLPGTTFTIAMSAGLPIPGSNVIPPSLTLIWIEFAAEQSKRSHPRLELIANNLTGTDKPIVNISKNVEGKPVNSIAPLIASDATPPTGVAFSTQPILIGDLKPGDKIPIWFKRTTPANTTFSDKDFFVLRLSGKPTNELSN